MSRKLLACSAACLIIPASVVFFGKDLFLKKLVIHSVNSKPGLSCSVAQARLSLRALTIAGIDIQAPGGRLTVGQSRLDWDYCFPRIIRSVRVALRDPALVVSDPAAFQKKITDLASGSGASGGASVVPDLSLSIDNGTIDVTGIARVKGLGVVRRAQDEYTVTIPSVSVKEKELTDLGLTVTISESRVGIVPARHAFFGPDAAIKITVDYADRLNVCAEAAVSGLSFEKIISFFNDKGDIEFSGLYDGGAVACFGPAGVRAVTGRLICGAGGLIRVKDESALAFLRPYLDSASYKALVDNFKNYSYNNGEISLTKDDGNLGITMHFVSGGMGTRNIGIMLHDVLNGGR